MTTRELDEIRTEITHALANANRETMEPLNSINEAIEILDEREGDPKPDRLDSIREELETLESSSEGETREHLRNAREHLRAFQENREFLDDREDVGSGGGTSE